MKNANSLNGRRHSSGKAWTARAEARVQQWLTLTRDPFCATLWTVRVAAELTNYKTLRIARSSCAKLSTLKVGTIHRALGTRAVQEKVGSASKEVEFPIGTLSSFVKP